LRRSLNNWRVSKAKIEPKTEQGILRPAYPEDSEETKAAQGKFSAAVQVSATVN
jgi:hypothetical protein